MIRFSLYIPDEVYEAIRKEAYEAKIPMNQIILSKIKGNTKIISKPTGIVKTVPDAVRIEGIPLDTCKHGALPSLCRFETCHKNL